ncbi:MAG: FtsX-like permease family protein [Candidatus Omnitrophica bacterium]|nr:FtsX-like permease family protein [Candidatus Omnitrophota bacterium]
MITLKIAIRNIFRHKTRTIITLSTIVFGAVAVIFAGGFFEDIFYKMRESYIHAHTGHIQIYKKGFLEKGRIEPYNYLIENPKDIIPLISAIKGVKFVTQRLQFSGLISTGENTISFLGMGVEPKYEPVAPLESNDLRKATENLTMGGVIVTKGKALSKDDKYSVMLGQGLGSAIGAKPADSIVLLTNTVNGSVNALDVTVNGIFYTSSKAFDDHFLRIPLYTAQKLLATDSVQTLVVMLNKTEDTKRVKKAIAGIIRDKKLDLEIKSWDELSDFYNQTVKLFNRLFLIMKFVIVIVVILSIFNTMNMAVFERVSEIGTIMALGTKRRGVIKLFMYEGLGLGVIGGIIGLISGALITSLVAAIGIHMPPPPGATMHFLSEPRIVPGMLLFAFILSILTSLISSFYPAYRASRLEIADALRQR